MIIAFEGGEGSGKDTQVKLLEKALLSKKRYNILTIVEPGGTPTGQEIRKILLDKDDLDILPLTETYLFSAARTQQIEKVVKPALQKGKIIISNRSCYSTYALQGYAGKVSLENISTLTDIAIGDNYPNYVVLLDVTAEIGLARKRSQNEINRIDKKSLSYHRDVRKGYLTLAKKYSDFWHVVDATLSIEEVHQDILDFVLSKIKQV